MVVQYREALDRLRSILTNTPLPPLFQVLPTSNIVQACNRLASLGSQ